MKDGNGIFGARFTLRRLFWSVLLALILLLVAQCSWQSAAQLPHPARHHPAVTA